MGDRFRLVPKKLVPTQYSNQHNQLISSSQVPPSFPFNEILFPSVLDCLKIHVKYKKHLSSILDQEELQS